jgi:multiple sugar transport system permease protein
MVKPALIVIMIMTMQGAWGDFLNPLIYLADEAKWTLALAIKSFTGSYATSWNFFMAGNVMYLLPMLLLFIVAQKYFMQGLGSLNNAGLK